MSEARNEETELTVLPVIEYEYTLETAKALVAGFPAVPEYDPSLGKRDSINAKIIADSKFWNKVESTREKIRKQTKEPGLTFCREVDARSKELHEIFEPMKIEYGQARKQIDDYEKEQEQKRIEAEQTRVNKINEEISVLRMIPSNSIGFTSEALTNIYSKIEVPDDLVFKERLEEAIEVYKDTMNKLESMIATAKGAEEVEKVRQEAEAKHQAEKKALEEEARKERETFEAEKAEFEAEKKARQSVIDAEDEERAKKKAEEEAEAYEKEQAEQAKIFKERQEEEARQSKVVADAQLKIFEKEATEALYNIVEENINETRHTVAEAILEAIISEQIPHVKWLV